MTAIIQKLDMALPYCDARSATDILVAFRPPAATKLQLGDALEVDLFQLDREQTIYNQTQGISFSALIRSHDIHDLRLPGGHRTSRFPTAERRLEQPPRDRAA